jgi:hypothetical protein
MKTVKSSSAGDFQLLSSFEEIRGTLADAKFEQRRQKPLAYWVLPTDRRLPLAFLGLSLDDILNKSYEDLAATAGIGQKKISTLVKLLHRAAQEKQPDSPYGLDTLAHKEIQAWSDAAEPEEFDADTVSEAHWTLWRETVRRHDMGRVKFGRIAPTLEALPTVIWNTPLEEYLDCTLEQLRSKKTHGEKRVRVVLEVFFIVHRMLGGSQPQSHLRFCLQPKFIEPIDAWLSQALAQTDEPSTQEIRDHLVLPLLAQVEIDAGADVRELAEGRLGVGHGRESVRSQSRRLGVTRARVYQLLEEASKVMEVRWPEGRARLNELLLRFWPEVVEDEGVEGHLLYAARDLFYPTKVDYVDEFAEREAAFA